MARSLMGRAFTAARAGASATSSSAMRLIPPPFAAGSGRSESAVSAGLSECGGASIAARSPKSPDVRRAQPSVDARATSGTTPPVVGMAGPGNESERRSWSATAIGALHAAPWGLGSRLTTSSRWRQEARTRPPISELFVWIATGLAASLEAGGHDREARCSTD